MTEIIPPYFSRDIVKPPSKLGTFELLDYWSSLRSIIASRKIGNLSAGSADLAVALLGFGGTREFPGGVGLLYNFVFKHTFHPAFARNFFDEITPQLKGRVNCILAPEHSSSIPAGVLAVALGDIPVIKIRKNGTDNKAGYLGAQIDSYTGGGKDTLVLEKDRLAVALRMIGGDLKALLFDEIIDAGTMTHAVLNIIDQARKKRFPITLVDIVALIEKKYTGASREIEKTTGIKPKTGLKIEDLGISPDWVKIEGVDGKALSFLGMI